ncbi:MAG TPA: hypothetical protein VEZ90_17365, partial [Blastocatellia bacterium]|nr:hypothetical protein [Blastocatellia bacterium]
LDTLLCEIHETGARTLVVRDAFGWTEPGLDYLQTGGELSNTFRPAVYVHIGQLLACRRAIWKGLSANSPRHLSRTVLLDV